MAQKGFELGDNWQNNSNREHEESHLALLQDSGMAHIERVADKNKQPSQTEDATTPAERQFNAAAKELESAKGDKTTALLELGPKFDAAIKTADDDFATTLKSAKTEIQTLGPDYEKATANVEVQQQKLVGLFAKVPENEKDKVSALVEAYARLGSGDQAIKSAIEQGLAKYPGLIQGVDDLNAANNAPAIKQMEALEAKVKRAMQDRILTRTGYAEILSKNGMEDRAEEYLLDAARIMGIPVPEKKEQNPNGLLKA